MTQKSRAFELWADFYKNADGAGDVHAWPSETLVRLFRGSYIPGQGRDHEGKSVIDVGFGDGNNLVLCGSLGMELHGIEVDSEICDLVRERMDGLDYKTDLREGTNTEIPFDDASFDYLISWNVLHYEGTEEELVRAIEEYQRVLKPGGRLFLSTAGPDDYIHRDAERLGKHRYRIGDESDFRHGQVFFFFNSPEDIEHYFSKSFSSVLVGRSREELFTDVQDYWIVTATRP